MATNTIQAFSSDMFGTIRTIEESGKVLFCGRDVATALGYVNTKDALARHCKGIVKRYPLQTPGGIQQMRFITRVTSDAAVEMCGILDVRPVASIVIARAVTRKINGHL